MDLYQQIFFSTIAIAFAILHFLLFYYNRNLKSNLYFTFFLVFYALNIFFDYQIFITPSDHKMMFLRIHRLVMPFNSVFGLLFIYSIFLYKIPKHFWIISSAVILAGIYAVADPIGNFIYLQYFEIVIIAEIIRILMVAFHDKKENIVIIATGFLFLLIFSLYDLIMDFGYINPVYGIHNGYPFGFLILNITISVHLARDYARINQKIILQQQQAKEREISRRILEAEDKRKSAELEEARILQLSLLPDCAPSLQNMDICFDMKTASEVGGDYYDYLIQEDNSILLAIGDATGHGMKAGIMVSIIKGLFLTHARDMEFQEFFNQCSKTIKQMKLKNLYMAMMLVKIHNSTLVSSSAGIPPIIIYRQNSRSIEELVTKGMPLGAFDSFKYENIQTDLSSGDILLFMTDGLSELFNQKKEEFGFSRIKDTLLRSVDLTADEIVQALLREGDKWKGNKAQNDDISLVVIKIK